MRTVRPMAHILGMIFNTPQLMTPDLMFEAVAFAHSHLGVTVAGLPSLEIGGAGVRIATDDDTDADSDTDPNDDGDGIAIIGVYGPLVPRRGNVELCKRMTSYESLSAQIDAALADPNVYRIVLDVDSPGGAATGSFELANKIRAANAIKPVHAIVNFAAFSGGYLLACAAGEISVSQSSGVGSIGVIAQHLDVSKMDEKLGVKVTAVYRGARKNDLNPHEPLSDASLATLNAMIDRTYADFVGTVAANRNMTPAAVQATEAGLFYGQNAVDAGLADRLETPQDAINRIAAEAQATRAATLKAVPATVGMQTNRQRLRMQADAMSIANSL